MPLDFKWAFGYCTAVNVFTNLTVSQLKRAVAIKERIEELERELASVVGRDWESSPTARQSQPKKRRRMSAAARAKIAAAARARWAKYRAAKSK
jgi:hypothetical protein